VKLSKLPVMHLSIAGDRRAYIVTVVFRARYKCTKSGL